MKHLKKKPASGDATNGWTGSMSYSNGTTETLTLTPVTTPATNRYIVSGTITSGGTGLAGVTLQYGIGAYTATTDSSGTYSTALSSCCWLLATVATSFAGGLLVYFSFPIFVAVPVSPKNIESFYVNRACIALIVASVFPWLIYWKIRASQRGCC